MMKRHNNGISEDHIVAYLDGELNVNGEMREALGDEELLQVAKEYAVLKKIFAHTSSDPRLLLNKSTDARVLAYLHNIFHADRNSARMRPDADAVPRTQTVIIRTKKFWVKRSVLGMALALFLGILWFATQPGEQPTAPTIAGSDVKSEHVQPSAPQAIMPSPIANEQSLGSEVTPSTRTAVSKRSTKQSTPIVANAIVPDEKPSNIVANQPPETPADIMISRRYAKLIKDVRIVEVTQQDKM